MYAIYKVKTGVIGWNTPLRTICQMFIVAEEIRKRVIR